jgi:exonuclease III
MKINCVEEVPPTGPPNLSIPSVSNYTFLGWNARSIRSRMKLDFLVWLLEVNKPDIAIIVETWANSSIWLKHQGYSVLQIGYRDSSGVCIIFQKGMEMKKENVDECEGCILVCSLRKNNRVVALVVGVYRRFVTRSVIDSVVSKTLRRIGIKFPAASIILFGDLNVQNPSIICKKWGLKVGEGNENFITRSQTRMETTL